MELDWYCNDMLEMRHQWIFKRLLVSLLRRQRSPRLNVWFLIVNIWVNRVGIVSSVITKIFNPSKYCTVTTQPLLNDTLLISACIVYCQFSLFDIVRLLFDSVFLFDSVLLFDSVFLSNSVLLFDSVLLFCILIIQCIFSPDTGNVFQVFWSHFTTTNKQSINIIQQTAPSFVLV